MACEKVANMTQMRHDNLANALRLVISACSCQSAAEPRYRALAGKKGMVECQRRGDIVAVLLRLELAAVDVVQCVCEGCTLLRLPRQLGGLRRGLNGPSGRGSGRMFLIMLHSRLCRLRLRCAGTWARRR